MGFNLFNEGFSSFCFFKYRSKFEILKTNVNPSRNIRGQLFFFQEKNFKEWVLVSVRRPTPVRSSVIF